MKKLYFSVTVAIAMVLAVVDAEAQGLKRLCNRPQKDHSSLTREQMIHMLSANEFNVSERTYLNFLATEVNMTLWRFGFVYDSTDGCFHGRIEGVAQDVKIPVFTAERMKTVWEEYTFIDHYTFQDSMYTFGANANKQLVLEPRMQYPWERDFMATDIANLPGMQHVKATGWGLKIILASCYCANPITGAAVVTEPQIKKEPLSAQAKPESSGASGGNTYVSNTYNVVNSNNTIAGQAPPMMNTGYPMMNQGYPVVNRTPMVVAAPAYYGGGMPRYNVPCEEYQPSCDRYFEGGHRCNPEPRYRPQPKPRPVIPIDPGKPTVRNVKTHQNPSLNTRTDGVTVVKNHDEPGAGGTTRYDGGPSLNLDAGPSVIDHSSGRSSGRSYGMERSSRQPSLTRSEAPQLSRREQRQQQRFADHADRQRVAAPSYSRSSTPYSRGAYQRPNIEGMRSYRQAPAQMQSRPMMAPRMQSAPRQSYAPVPRGSYRMSGGYSRGGGGRR